MTPASDRLQIGLFPLAVASEKETAQEFALRVIDLYYQAGRRGETWDDAKARYAAAVLAASFQKYAP